MTVQITRLEHDADALRQHAGRVSAAPVARRLLALASVLEGHSRRTRPKVDGMFSEHRDMAAAKAFFESSANLVICITPDRVTTDGYDSYPRAIRTILGAGVRHRDSQYLHNRLKQDHRKSPPTTAGSTSFAAPQKF
jgi:hypothetical protein